MASPEETSVALLSHSDGGGGAARAAFRLHSALRTSGVRSSMLVDFKDTTDPDVRMAGSERATWRRRTRIHVDQLPGWAFRLPDPGGFSPGLSSALTHRSIERLDADVVNVHWTGFGFLSVAQFGRIRTPVVWTLHDMWAVTGGRFYDDESTDAPWRSGYAEEPWSLEKWTWKRKKRHWTRPRHIVTPSNWLSGLVEASPLTGDWPVITIPNALDTSVFVPIPGARSALNLPPESPLALIALGGDLEDSRKGWDLLQAALVRLHERRPDLELVIVGPDGRDQTWDLRLPKTHWLGRIDEDRTMAQAYSAADVVVVPSRQDNLPQTGTEAAACGTPVVAFAIGGLTDVVEHQESGYLAPAFDTDGLAEGIAWVLETRERSEHLGRRARERAERLWSPAVVANQYQAVFEEAARQQSTV